MCLGGERGLQKPNLARDCDEHELLPRPNVEVVGRDAKARLDAAATAAQVARFCRLRKWADLKFAPQRVDVLLLVVHARELHEVVADSRVGPISPDHQVELNLDLLRAIRRAEARATRVASFEPGLAFPEVCAGKLVVEEKLDIGHGLEDV